MKYRETIDYPVPCARVLAKFATAGFLQAKYEGQGARNIQLLEESRDGDTTRYTFTRDVPVQVDVPAFARSLVPASITLIQTDTWNAATRSGRLDIAFKGMPVQLRCDMRLEDRAGGSHHTLDFNIQVNVPLIGGKLEKLLAEDLRMKFQHDTAVSQALVAAD